MVDLPLIVSRPDGRRFYQDGERDLLADGLLWARFDAEQGGVGAMEATIRDDRLCEHAWNGLDAAARRFFFRRPNARFANIALTPNRT